MKKVYKFLANQPKYRIKQAKIAIYRDLIFDWDQASNLPLELRQELNQACPLGAEVEYFISDYDKTVKSLITLEDGEKIESVLLRHNDGRNSVCVSAQVGCALGCKFCATGSMGFKRNLEIDEIVIQVLLMSRYLKEHEGKGTKITNVIFMGMGEPFLNYDNIMGGINILNDHEGFNLGARHISISTSGIVEGIEKFSFEKLQVNLAISLHAPNKELRSQLMPINNKYPLDKVLKAVKKYITKTNRLVMFEYLMIKGVNDDLVYAKQLVKLLEDYLCMVNLISYNPTGKFEPSDNKQMERFKQVLERGKIKVTRRKSFGQDIEGACGQLAGKK